MRKKSTIRKSAGVWCFSKPARPGYNHKHFNSIKNALKIIFLQNSRFLHFSPKKWSEKQLSRNTAEFLPNKMHIFRHKFISILFALGQKKLSLKSDQLEVSGSVYGHGSHLGHVTSNMLQNSRNDLDLQY